jgi:hypothetical protein
MADSPSSTHDPPFSRHRSRGSLVTCASGIADSTISVNTYATGITEGSLCLSQFPPPPMTFSAGPSAERSLPSPAQSAFTVTASTPIGFTTSQGYPSPARSTFTVTAPAHASPVSRVPSPSSDQGSPQNRACSHLHRARSPPLHYQLLSAPHVLSHFLSLNRYRQQRIANLSMTTYPLTDLGGQCPHSTRILG